MKNASEQLIGEGLSPEEAERQARIAFGNRRVVEERSREVWQWPTLESIWADVRIRGAPTAALSRICMRRHFHPGAGHRRKRRGLWRIERADPAPV